MRRTILSLAAALLLPAIARAEGGSVTLRGGGFRPTDAIFRSVYGRAWSVSLQATAPVLGRLEAWFEVGWLGASGGFTETREPTRLTMTPVSGGVRYSLPLGSLRAFAGAGPLYGVVRETNRLGTKVVGGPGFALDLGADVRLKGPWSAQVRARWWTCRMDSGWTEFQSGGW